MISIFNRKFLLIGLIAGLYFAFAKIGLVLVLEETNASPVWLPSGFSLACILLFGRKVWPGIFIGAFASNYHFLISSDVSEGIFVLTTIIALGNTLEAVIAHYILKSLKAEKILDEARSFVWFLLSAILASAIPAVIGTFTIWLSSGDVELNILFATWWMGDLSGIIVLAPAIIIWRNEPVFFVPIFKPWVSLLSFLFLFFLLEFIFNTSDSFISSQNKVYHIFLFIGWCVFCMNTRQLSLVILITSIFAISYTLEGVGPFVESTLNRSLISVLVFICIVTISTLLLNVTLRERKLSENYLRKVNAELENTKAELVRTMKEKDQFVANMSHEVRTPMNAIVGFTNLLQSTPLNEEQKNYVNAVKNSGDNLLVIINDILDFSKIRSGKISFEVTSFNLSRVMNDVFEIQCPKALNKNIQLQIGIDEDVPDHLVGDPIRLHQVLLNLVSNAVKFTEKGNVKVTVSKRAETDDSVQLVFKVIDSGIGIRKSKLPIIFEAFTQANNETTRKYGGSGLGLTIVKELIEKQNGSIEVESKVNQGTTFTFELGFKKCTSSTVLGDKKNKFPMYNLGLNILVVEDNILNQLLVQKILSNWHCKTAVVDNGLLAIRELEKNPDYDLVLMDIQLPEMDGYEATRYIRNKMGGRGKTYPIIALTAHAMTGEAEKCYEAGMNAYLSKPFEPEQLYRKINSVVKREEVSWDQFQS